MILAIAALLLQLQPSPSTLSTLSTFNLATTKLASTPVLTTEVAVEPSSNGTSPSGAGETAAAAATVTVTEPAPIHWNLSAVAFDLGYRGDLGGKGANVSVTFDLGDKGDKGAAKGPALASLNNVSLGDTQKQGISTVRVPDPEPAKPIQITPAETLHPSRAWLALSFVQHSAAAFDAYSTRQAIGRGAVESDPIMRPFVHSGALYGAIQVGPVLLDFVARRMQRSENNFFRRMWWMPQSLATAGFLFSGVHNMGVSSNLKH